MTGTRAALLALFLNVLLTGWTFAQSESGDTTITIGNVHINGEGGLAFFDTGSEGQFPNSEFRVDEAKLFVEAALGMEIYAFVEINLLQREEEDEHAEIGELYIDFEHVLRSWNHANLLNVRFGRVDIPFGEEYLTRDAIDNPLISHSIMDFWGVDEGIEAYGSIHQFRYAVAVLNGGDPFIRDFNPDKSVSGQFTYDFPKWVHLCFSAMRTGKLDVRGDVLSELWLTNGFLRSLGSSSTTHFGGNLFLAEAQLNWPRGHFRGGFGQLHYYDNDPVSENERDLSYYQFEAVHRLSDGNTNVWQVATRFGRAESDEGFPIVGHGNRGRFFFGGHILTTSLWRWSLGVGYRPNQNVFLKAEYTWERGEEIGELERNNEDFFGAEVAFKF